MAKKNYMKHLSKAGSAAAVAVAMSFALSTQAQAAEITDVEPLRTDIPPADTEGSGWSELLCPEGLPLQIWDRASLCKETAGTKTR